MKLPLYVSAFLVLYTFVYLSFIYVSTSVWWIRDVCKACFRHKMNTKLANWMTSLTGTASTEMPMIIASICSRTSDEASARDILCVTTTCNRLHLVTRNIINVLYHKTYVAYKTCTCVWTMYTKAAKVQKVSPFRVSNKGHLSANQAGLFRQIWMWNTKIL